MQAGYYTILEVDEEGLTITPSAHAVAEQAEFQAMSFCEAHVTLLEDHLTDGWEIILPEEIGALTSANILSNECERNDDGKIVQLGALYSDIDFYQLRFWYEDMFKNGSVKFRRCD